MRGLGLRSQVIFGTLQKWVERPPDSFELVGILLGRVSLIFHELCAVCVRVLPTSASDRGDAEKSTLFAPLCVLANKVLDRMVILVSGRLGETDLLLHLAMRRPDVLKNGPLPRSATAAFGGALDP